MNNPIKSTLAYIGKAIVYIALAYVSIMVLSTIYYGLACILQRTVS